MAGLTLFGDMMRGSSATALPATKRTALIGWQFTSTHLLISKKAIKMAKIGQFAQDTKYTILDEDIYSGVITSAEVDMDEKGSPKLDKYLKSRLIVRVAPDNQFDEDGKPVSLRRSLAISYGKNSQTGKWSDLASLITIVTGIPQGSPAQREVDTDEFVGKRTRFKTINVEKDGNTYTNIEMFLAMPKEQTRTGAPAGNAAGLARSQSHAARQLPPEDDGVFDPEMPF